MANWQEIKKMGLDEILTESIGTLALNKVRTGLAMLGVIIGIGSVITLVSLGQASQKSVENQIKSLGANLITVSPAGQNVGGVRGAAGGGTTLTLADAEAIENSSECVSCQWFFYFRSACILSSKGGCAWPYSSRRLVWKRC